MEKEMKKIILEKNGIRTTFIKTDKFKTVTFQIVFASKFTKENAAKRSLLSLVLGNSSGKYNTKKKAIDKMCDLYGATISVNCNRYHETSVIIFNLEFINERNLPNSDNLNKKAFEFFADTILNPNAYDNQFSEKEFNEEKNILIQSIQKIYNNKYRYSLRKMIEVMCHDEITGYSTSGTIEDVNKITSSELYQEYLSMINNDQISMYIVGDLEEKKLLNDLKIFANLRSSDISLNTYLKENYSVKKIKEIREVQKVSQAKLVMGFRSDINSADERFYQLILFNEMFGGLASSDLFRVVREENNLAYDIASLALVESKLFIITAGIETKDYELTKNLIIEQLTKYKNGDISEELLDVAKKALISDLEQTNDNPYDILSYIQDNHFLKIDKSVEESIKNIEEIQINDIKDAALGIKLDTIFLLANEE